MSAVAKRATRVSIRTLREDMARLRNVLAQFRKNIEAKR
jgi:hypothetical protein